jgi:fibronectin type 3 domain-containing protein
MSTIAVDQYNYDIVMQQLYKYVLRNKTITISVPEALSNRIIAIEQTQDFQDAVNDFDSVKSSMTPQQKFDYIQANQSRFDTFIASAA